MGKSPESTDIDRLMLAHLPAALSFAVKLTGSSDAAEDLLQSALLNAARSFGAYRAESSFKTWLYRIIINCHRDQLSRRRPMEQVPHDVVDHHAPSPLARASARELGDRIAGAILHLPPRQREVIVLHTYEGMSSDEIAAVLEISEANVRKNLQLARDRLREALAGYIDDPSHAH